MERLGSEGMGGGCLAAVAAAARRAGRCSRCGAMVGVAAAWAWQAAVAVTAGLAVAGAEI